MQPKQMMIAFWMITRLTRHGLRQKPRKLQRWDAEGGDEYMLNALNKAVLRSAGIKADEEQKNILRNQGN